MKYRKSVERLKNMETLTRQETGKLLYSIKDQNQEAFEELTWFLDESPVYIWLTGNPCSGKSFMRPLLKRFIQGQTRQPIHEFSDGEYILKAVSEDIDQRFHQKTETGGFKIISGQLDDKLYGNLLADLPTKDINLIECMRAIDGQKVRDVNYPKLMEYLGQYPHIRDRSIVIGVCSQPKAILTRDLKRNGNGSNGDFRRTASGIVQRFIQNDFRVWRSSVNMPTILIEN